MSGVVPRVERSLYLLGCASDSLLASIDTLWFVLAPTDTFPAHREDLVRDVRQAADELAEHSSNERIQEIARHVSERVAAAWSHFRDTWPGVNHTHAHNLNEAAEPETIPEDLWFNSSPLHASVWVDFCGLLTELVEELEPRQRFFLRLGGVVGQAASFGFAGQETDPDGRPSLIETLRVWLRDLEEFDSSFAGLRPLLSDAFLPDQSAGRSGVIRQEIERLHRELLQRLERPAEAMPRTSSSSDGREERVPDGAPDVPRRREPPGDAFRAYRLFLGLQTVGTGHAYQTRIAEIMSRELGRPISQGTICRWLKSVREWMAISGIPLNHSSPPPPNLADR